MMSTVWTVEQLQFAFECQKRRFKAALDEKDLELARRLVPYLDLTRKQLNEAKYQEQQKTKGDHS
jgi:hypothetical protein